jgi:hypothetical protein
LITTILPLDHLCGSNMKKLTSLLFQVNFFLLETLIARTNTEAFQCLSWCTLHAMSPLRLVIPRPFLRALPSCYRFSSKPLEEIQYIFIVKTLALFLQGSGYDVIRWITKYFSFVVFFSKKIIYPETLTVKKLIKMRFLL